VATLAPANAEPYEQIGPTEGRDAVASGLG
jgi:hypothetical protein